MRSLRCLLDVTGVSILNQELEGIRLERLVEVVPQATTIGVLINPASLTIDPKLSCVSYQRDAKGGRCECGLRTSHQSLGTWASASCGVGRRHCQT
jgi:hypothetical protein